MGFDNFLTEGGRGTQQVRLVIEGCEDVWVSHEDLVGTHADGRTWRKGLWFESPFVLDERTFLKDAQIKVSSATATINERNDNAATRAFAYRGRPVSWLTEDVDDSTTTFPVTEPAAFTVGERYHIGTECVKVTAIGASSVTVDRGEWDSQAQYHYARGGEHGYTPITDAPATLRNRRVWVYVYEGSDLRNGVNYAGTLVWRGRILQPPVAASPTAWAVQIDHLVSILEQELARSSDRPIGLRGIYYHWRAPLSIVVKEHSTSAKISSVISQIELLVTGFYATEEEFCASVSDAIATQVASDFTTDPVIVAVPDPVRGWYFQVRPDPADVRYIDVYAESAIDGQTRNALQADIDDPFAPPSLTGATYYAVFSESRLRTSGGDRRRGSAIEDSYRIVGAPRMYFGADPIGLDDITAFDTAPTNRIYVTDSTSLDAAESVSFEDAGGDTWELPIDSVGSGYFEHAYGVGVGPNVAGDAGTEFRAIFEYVTEGNLDDFRNAIVAQAPKANAGSHPHVTGQDLADWTSWVEFAVADRRFGQRRRYVFTKPKKLGEVLQEEAKLIGGYYRLDSAGKIDFRPLLVTPRSLPAAVTLDSSNIIRMINSRPVFPRWAQEIDGIANICEVNWAYDAREDKHSPYPYEVRDALSIADFKDKARLVIKPYSELVDDSLRWEDAVQVAEVPLAFFSQSYEIVEIDVNWKVFDAALCGTTVSITDETIPNTEDGTRGITDRYGLIIGRRWEFPGFGTLTVLLLDIQDIGGYAPSAQVTGGTDNGGDDWTLTVTQSVFSGEEDDSSFFEAGTYVEVAEDDSWAPAVQTGVVVSTTATTIRVQFDGTPPWGGAYSGSHVLRFRDDVTGYSPTEHMQKFVFIAGPALLDYAGDPPKRYAA